MKYDYLDRINKDLDNEKISELELPLEEEDLELLKQEKRFQKFYEFRQYNRIKKQFTEGK